MHPQTVYLDSSDYSNIASATGDQPFADRQRWLGLRARILAAKADGKAVFRFSYPIVMEAYPTSPEHLTHGLNRASAISEVCGQSCLVDFLSLITEEGQALALKNEQFRRESAWRDDGAWHPNPDGLLNDSIADFRTSLPDLLRSQLKGSGLLNRKTRRSIETSMVSRNGTPTKKMISMFTMAQRQELSVRPAGC